MADFPAALPNFAGMIGGAGDRLSNPSLGAFAQKAAEEIRAIAESLIPAGTIVMWSGDIGAVPTGWRLCDGGGGTPNLRNRFIVGAGGQYELGDTGGFKEVSLTVAELPQHSHTIAHTHQIGHTHANSHNHTMTHTHGSGSYGAGLSASSSITIGRRGTSSEDHQHTANESSFAGGPHTSLDLPNLSYPIPQHTHSVSGTSGGSSSSTTGAPNNSTTSGASPNTSGASSAATSGNIGSGNAHENRPPYYALAFIMKLAIV